MLPGLPLLSFCDEVACTLSHLPSGEARERRTEITKVLFNESEERERERERERAPCTLRHDSWSQGCRVREGAKDIVVVAPLIVR